MSAWQMRSEHESPPCPARPRYRTCPHGSRRAAAIPLAGFQRAGFNPAPLLTMSEAADQRHARAKVGSDTGAPAMADIGDSVMGTDWTFWIVAGTACLWLGGF